MGDQLQQVVSRPDHGAVVAHPSTLADIEPIRNGRQCEAAGVACLPSSLLILSQKGTFVNNSLPFSFSLGSASG